MERSHLISSMGSFILKLMLVVGDLRYSDINLVPYIMKIFCFMRKIILISLFQVNKLV
jgi:hypothetical protein